MKAKETISTDLKFKGNPRKISEKQKDFLVDHIEELGDLSGVVYCQKNQSYVGGNQRADIFDKSAIEIIETYKKPNKTGTVAYGFINYNGERFAYREVQFSPKQFQKACIVANNDGGENDWEILAGDEWNNKDLIEWGLEGLDIEDEGEYTNKIEAPNYEPSENEPEIVDLFNDEKAKELIEEINNSEIDESTKDFLIQAAKRHTVFNYQSIADFYCHADKEIQILMEKSALVIIDYDKAIEYGYVEVTEKIKSAFTEDHDEGK